jgi:hypothetical protein
LLNSTSLVEDAHKAGLLSIGIGVLFVNGELNFPKPVVQQHHIAVSRAASVPPSTAIPTSAYAKAGESLMSSPTTALSVTAHRGAVILAPQGPQFGTI